MKTSFRIHNDLSELHTLFEKLQLLKTKWSLPKKVATEINLVLDELVTNTITYGDCNKNQHIDITITKTGQELSIEIVDQGQPFDPTICTFPDINLPLDKRRCGGLGILLVRRFCTHWKYRRQENKNILTLQINLAKEPGSQSTPGK